MIQTILQKEGRDTMNNYPHLFEPIQIGDGAKVGNIKDAISGAYELARNL